MTLLVALVGALGLGAGPASAGPPKGFAVQTLVSGLEDPVEAAWAPDGRVFIIEKAGVVKVLQAGKLREFADLRARVNNIDDRGLLGLALDPHFGRNGWIYLAYTKELRPDDPDQDTPVHPAGGTVIRLRSSRADPGLADLSSIHTVLDGLPTPGAWHSVGDLAFDQEGNLIVGMGDGSPYFPKDIGPTKSGEVSALDALDLDSPNGKLLRVDPETGHGVRGNPYYDAAHPDRVRSKVIADGLRNPFRFSVDPGNGDIWIGDPGSSDWEELDFLPSDADAAQRNFGWPCYEGGPDGLLEQSAMVNVPACIRGFYSRSDPPAEAPVYAYHFTGSAIIGGPVYEGDAYPGRYRGRVFFADLVHDIFFTYHDGKTERFGTPGGWGTAVNLVQTPRGNIAYVAFGTGQLRVIRSLNPPTGGRSGWWWVLLAGVVVAGAGAALVVGRRARSRAG